MYVTPSPKGIFPHRLVDLTPMEVKEGTARSWSALTLVARTVLFTSVWVLGWGGEFDQTELADLHTRK
jgi:hypothetical protein